MRWSTVSAKLAILGLLVEQPLHGYGVERLIEQRGMRKWTSIGFSSIYHLLDQLVAEGLADVVVEPAPGRGKERRVHHVTALGREEWLTETLRALSEVAETDSDFLTAFSCLPLLEPGDAVDALERRRVVLVEHIELLDHDRERVEPVPDHVGAMFDYTRTRLTAAHRWLTVFLEDLATTPARLEAKP